MTKKNPDQGHIDSNHQTTNPKCIKAMKACLNVAAQIRRELEGRTHSNSTELVAEERQR